MPTFFWIASSFASDVSSSHFWANHWGAKQNQIIGEPNNFSNVADIRNLTRVTFTDD